MQRTFQELDQLPTVCMVGEGYTEEAFLRAFKRKVRSESGLQPLPVVSIFTIGTGGGDLITAIQLAIKKIFRDNHSHRRVLFIDTENKQVLPQHEEFAREYGIELCWSKPCIERHLLQMYGFTLSSSMSVAHYKSELKKKLSCSSRHLVDHYWHIRQLEEHAMNDLISRDDLAKQLHQIFTDTMHPKFGNRTGN